MTPEQRQGAVRKFAGRVPCEGSYAVAMNVFQPPNPFGPGAYPKGNCSVCAAMHAVVGGVTVAHEDRRGR